MINIKNLKTHLIYITPFLIGIYPVLFLYSHNIKEYTEEVLAIPFLVSIILSSVIFVSVKFLLKNTAKASLVSSLLIFTFFSYSTLFIPFSALTFFNFHPKILYFGVVIFIIIVVWIFIIRTKNDFHKANIVLFFLVLFLVLLQLFQIVSYEIREGRILRGEYKVKKGLDLKSAKVKNAPDIYYIMPEEYGSLSSLKEQYGYDNSPLINFLKKKGFYVADKSTTNYARTFLSLTSSLNFKYLNFLTHAARGGNSSDQFFVVPLIQNNEVLNFLKKHGYYTVHLGSWWRGTSQNPYADKNFFFKKGSYWGSDEFTTLFINTTAIAPIINRFYHNPMDISSDEGDNSRRARFFYQFKTAESEIVNIPGPKFVFMHIISPHEPFVVDKKCDPVSEMTTSKKTEKQNYLEQLTCVDKKLTELINEILSQSKNAVILLQSDEGPDPINGNLSDNLDWLNADQTSYDEEFPILNSYYFPDKDYSKLYDSITPVNSFRVIFNKYFGTNLPLLPDKNYVFQDDHHYYIFTDVTQQVSK